MKMTNNLEMGAVRVLRRAASLGSMTLAARGLEIQPEAVRERIKTLERRTGKSLLRRSTRRCQLTESGRSLLESYAGLLEEELLETRRLLQRAPTGPARPGARVDITLRCLESGQWAASSRPLELIAVSPDLIETLRQIAQELVKGLTEESK